jgi:hypothetical protein
VGGKLVIEVEAYKDWSARVLLIFSIRAMIAVPLELHHLAERTSLTRN